MKITKPQRKKLNEILHKLCRLRDGAWCLKCKKKTYLQLSHIYPKGKHRTLEFDSRNCKLLCNSCHLFWWHKHPLEAAEWLKEVLPEKRLKQLHLIANTTGKILSYDEYKMLLEQEIKEYEKRV